MRLPKLNASPISALTYPCQPPPPPTLEANSPPAAPTGLAAAAGDGQITLSWNAADPNDNVSHYEYNVNHNDTGTGNLSGWSQWATVPGSGASTTSYIFTGLTNGREYRYHLRAVNANGESVGAPASGPPWFVHAVPNAPPDAPTGLAATAGVRSVTLSWNNPGDASITYYEYNVNHNATGTGNFTGWTPWTAVPDSDANTTSVTFNNLAGGREYRYHLRAVNDNGASVGAPASGPPWFASATPIAPPPSPAAPTNLRVERVCDHKLKVRWHRSAGATGYDLEIGSANRKHWKRLLTNWPGNSWYATNWEKDRSYRFAVRAVNDGGTSEWVDSALSVAPPCAVDNLRVVTGTPGEGDLGAVGGSITATWNAGHRANAYHLDYNGTREADSISATTYNWSVDSRGSSDTVSVQSVNGGMASPSRSASVAWLTAGSIVGTDVTLNLAGHAGDWHVKKTAPTPAGDCSTAISGTSHNLSGLAHSTAHTYAAYTDAACANAMATTTFTTGAGLSVSKIRATSVTLNLAGHSGQWWYDADTGPDAACQGPVAAGTSSDSLTGLTEHQQYTYTAYDAAGCNSGDALATITFEPSGDNLAAKNVTATTATLELSNHTGDWWFKETSPATGTCTKGDADFTNELSGLIPGTEYTYKSYDVDGCGNTHESASVTFTTGGVSVSNLASSSTGCNVGWFNGSKLQCALSFKTGTVEKAPNGYTLHSVTAKFIGNGLGSPTGFSVALYAADKTNPNNIKPAANALATLSGDAPSVSIATTNTYACSGGGCNLTANTDYFVVMSTNDTSNNLYQWQVSTSTGETLIPSNNGWSIGNNTLSGATWAGRENSVAHMKVAATVNLPATLTASGISGTGATLTVGGHVGAWSYQGISGTEASSTCVDVSNSTTSPLNNLTADKLYGYTAHNHASCSLASQLATEYFSTNDYDVGNLGEGAVSGNVCAIGVVGTIFNRCAVSFSTGDRSGGYTLKSVTGRFNAKSGDASNIIVKVHAADTSNSSNPGTEVVTLDGSDPDTAGLHTFTCSGNGCSLSASTKYFVMMSTTDTSGTKYYEWVRTASDSETVHPAGTTGWTIANVGRAKLSTSSWEDLGSSHTVLLHIAADE